MYELNSLMDRSKSLYKLLETIFTDMFLLLTLCFCLLKKLSFGKIGFSKAMSNKWIRVDKSHEGGPRIFRAVRSSVPICHYVLI